MLKLKKDFYLIRKVFIVKDSSNETKLKGRDKKF